MRARQLGWLGVIGVVVAALVGPSAGGARSETAEPVAVQVARQGWPWLSMGDGRPVPMMLAGASGPAGAGPALGTPQALAAGDFDEDGVPDLVSAYAGAGGGRLILHRGNVDAIYPYHPGARARRANGTFTAAPFLAPVRVFAVPEAPHFVATGD
ncbi:MAG TPA: hypothetical protein VGW35_21815, partial [Methylomirabilota bacterium]|nr:hypothetical protein [Methylomirabilota bacterium]